MDVDDFCETVRSNKELINRLYRKASVKLLNYICGVSLKTKKGKITLNPMDVAFIVNFSNSKISVIDKDHAEQLLREGKVQFYEVIV
jgi:hypothetical protein